jgi:hypothetical protein
MRHSFASFSPSINGVNNGADYGGQANLVGAVQAGTADIGYGYTVNGSNGQAGAAIWNAGAGQAVNDWSGAGGQTALNWSDGQASVDGVPFGAVGSEPNTLTMADLIPNFSVEEAMHAKVRSQLVQSVAALPADPMVKVIGTLNGDTDYVSDDWSRIGAACKAGQVDMGLLDAAGKVQSIFQADGQIYIKDRPAAEMDEWFKLPNPVSTNTAEQGVETPYDIASRLVGISQAANTQVFIDGTRSNFKVTGSAFRSNVAPKVSAEGGFTFEPAKSFAGVRAQFYGTSYMIVGSQQIKSERIW